MAPISRDGNSEATTSRNPFPNSDSTPKPPLTVPFTSHHIHIPRKFHSMVAGAGAGFVSSIVTCPLDVVKTRLQAQHLARDAKDYEGVQRTISRIWRQAGFRGFYRGLGPTLGGYLPTWGIYFTVYDLVKDRLGGYAKASAHPAAETAMLHVVAAMTAGATGTIMTNPLWVVKTRFMAQAILPPSSSRYRNTFDAISTIWRTEGFKAFYKGLLPSLMGVSHVAVQFPLYEKAKAWADRGRDHESDRSGLPPSTILACSAFSKMVASLATYPHEVLRTRLQIRRSNSPPSAKSVPSPSAILPQNPLIPRPPTVFYSPLMSGSNPPVPFGEHNSPHPRIAAPGSNFFVSKPGGVVDTFLSIRRQDGWRGFYRGLSINLVRTVPNSAVTMLTYELLMRRLS